MHENDIHPKDNEVTATAIQAQTDAVITRYAAYADQNWRDQRHPDTLTLQFRMPDSKGTVTFSTVKGTKTADSLLTDNEVAIDIIEEHRDKLYSSESYRLGRGNNPLLMQLLPYGDSGNEYILDPVDATTTGHLLDRLKNATPPEPGIKDKTAKQLGKISRLFGHDD